MVLSFVDHDMIMRYFGGEIGHLGNGSRHQVDSEPPDTEPENSELEEEMEISDDGGNIASAIGPLAGEVEDTIMNCENGDDEQGSGSESSDSSELDNYEGLAEDFNEDSDDDGYGSF